jgi:hypothetical protein
MIVSNEKDIEGSDLGIISGLSIHVFGQTEENHQTSQSEQKVSLPRYELGTSEIQVNLLCELLVYRNIYRFNITLWLVLLNCYVISHSCII